MTEELVRVCKKLRLAHVVGAYQDIPFDDREPFLLGVLQAELAGRKAARLSRLMKKAAFTTVKTFQGYDFSQITFPGTLTPGNLKSLDFITQKENVLMLGNTGTGKTHLATALGVEACRHGYLTRFFRVTDLVAILQDKHEKGTFTRFRQDLFKADLVILDEVGYIPFHQTGSELLFHVISGCYELTSVIVTSNLEFGRWNEVFGDNRLTTALVDRLVHHAHILAFTGESYRLKNALSGLK